MKALSNILSILAFSFIRAEWRHLSVTLRSVHQSCVSEDRQDWPSVLAQQLLISGEDHRFFSHGGVDLAAVFRALWRRVVFKRCEGASTIEMQIVRVVSGRYERTLMRKLREMALATLVTRVVPKGDLPALYLRIGYFGWRMTGFKAACQRLGLSANSLSRLETAQLVAQLKYPQPRTSVPKRRRQINSRAHHLLALHSCHKDKHTYVGLLHKPRYAAV